MKFVFPLVILIWFLTSCEKKNKNIIPSYIQINNITLNNSEETHNITDAWVYINDNLQGVYELPAHFPVLHTGDQKIRIKGGIKVNGIASTRIPYPFYESIIDTINLVLDSTVVFDTIKLNYFDNTEYGFYEDFESIGFDFISSGVSDTNLNIVADSTGNRMGYAIIEDPFLTFEASTTKLENLPQAGANVFLELDYKSTEDFQIGVYTAFSETVVQKEIMQLFAKDEWNKIYINLTNTISEGIGASYFKVYVGMQKPSSSQKAELYFDNFKIIY
jgi:hypothetical protein